MKRSKYQKHWCPSNELLAEFKIIYLEHKGKMEKQKQPLERKEHVIYLLVSFSFLVLSAFLVLPRGIKILCWCPLGLPF